MAKDESERENLADFIYGILESLRIASVLLTPVLPGKTRACLLALGGEEAVSALADGLDSAAAWGGLASGRPLERPEPLFPRLDQLRETEDE